MRLGAIVVSLVFAACALPDPPADLDGGTPDAATDAGPDPQRDYSYEGCEGGGLGCPNIDAYGCAFEKIRSKFAGCAVTADCAVLAWDDCVGIGSCGGVAVARAHEAAFLEEFGIERGRYCTDATCRSSGSCAWRADQPLCREGRCAAVRREDLCWTFDPAKDWRLATAPGGLALDSISVPANVTYWEVRIGNALMASWGQLCAGAGSPEHCAADFLPRAAVASAGLCAPDGCPVTLAWQAVASDAVGLAGDEARAFLGEVTSENEAVLVANIAGYATDGSAANSGVRTVAGGFEVVGTILTSTCAPIRVERKRVRVQPTGEAIVICAEVVSEDQNSCI